VSQIFLELGPGRPVQVDCGPSNELAHAIAQPIYQHAHGPGTVRHLQNSKAVSIHETQGDSTGPDEAIRPVGKVGGILNPSQSQG